MSTQVVVTLPDDLYHRAERLAQLTSREVAEVLVDTIALSLTSLSAQPASVTPVTQLTDDEVLTQAGLQSSPPCCIGNKQGSSLTWNVRRCWP